MTHSDNTVREAHPISYTLRTLMNQPEMADEVDALVAERDQLAAENERLREIEEAWKDERAARFVWTAEDGPLTTTTQSLSDIGRAIAAEAERDRLAAALERVMRELGVPGDGYSYPVAKAYEVARAALAARGGDA